MMDLSNPNTCFLSNLSRCFFFCSAREIWRTMFYLQFIDSSGSTLNALLEALNFFSNLSPLSCEYFRYTSTYFCPRFSSFMSFPFSRMLFFTDLKTPSLPLLLSVVSLQARTHSLICYWDVSEKNLSFSRITFEGNWL